MFQFQIYPSGAVSNYRTIVNSISGVTAILDHRMGIIENSLSGVAFYIKAISDYINQNNVGTSGLAITSGYFNHLGFTWYQRDVTGQYPYYTSLDGIVSGVNTIYSSGVSIYDTTPDIQVLHGVSGRFSNVIFNNGLKGACVIQDFVFTDAQQNLYSGYIPSQPDKRLDVQQPLIVDSTDYPFNLGSGGILNDILIRYRIESSNNELGLTKGMLTMDQFYVNNVSGIFTSGNLYILGTYKPNFDLYGDSHNFCESVFQMKSHRHTGYDSARLSAAKFNADRPVNNHFNVIQSSGNLNVGQSYTGNNIGLSCNWERVDIPDADNVQKLLTCKDKLYILDNIKLQEAGSDPLNYIQATVANYPRADVIATRTGDSPALIEMMKGRDYYLANMDDLENVNYFRVTPINSKVSSDLFFKYMGIMAPFGVVTARKEIRSDKGIRIGGKLYISLLETISAMSVLTLYEINTIATPMSMKAVAHYELQGIDWKFLKPIRFKNAIYYIFSAETGIKYVLVYNTIYRPSSVTFVGQGLALYAGHLWKHVFETSSGNRYGFNVFESTGTSIQETTGMDNIYIPLDMYPLMHSYTYYAGKTVVSIADTAFRFSPCNRNRLSIFSEIGTSATMSSISYAGRVWRGNCLYVARDFENRDAYYTEFKTRITEITGIVDDVLNDSFPWLIHPIIYKGWLYAIAPTVTFKRWIDERAAGISQMWLTQDYLPDGSIIVRRRAAETDLINMQAYSL